VFFDGGDISVVNADDWQEELSAALEAAQQAGSLIVSQTGEVRQSYKSSHEPVTETDRQAQQLIVETLKRNFPRDGFIGEEGGDGILNVAPAGPGRVWVIDPLDGTSNFVRRLPVVCVSIAMLLEGRPVVAVVREVYSGRVFQAVRGGGAHDQTGAPLRVSSGPLQKRRGFLGIETIYPDGLPDCIGDWMSWLYCRNLGSTALHMALVAAGVFDATFAYRCKLWDVAAGALLVAEAGGVVTHIDGSAIFPFATAGYAGGPVDFVAANRFVHSQIAAALHRDRLDGRA